MENERVSEINGRTDPDPPRSGLVQLLSQLVGPSRRHKFAISADFIGSIAL